MKKIVLGIDPGYDRCGIALLSKEKGKKEEVIHSTCVQTSSKHSFQQRIFMIGSVIDDCIDEYKPTEVASESLFFNQNVNTAIPVAGVRGIIAYLASIHSLPHREFSPQQVKVAVTGYGRSDKYQVITMINKQLALDDRKRVDDEYDAIAVALTALVSRE